MKAMYSLAMVHNYGIGFIKQCDIAVKLYKDIAEKLQFREYWEGYIHFQSLEY